MFDVLKRYLVWLRRIRHSRGFGVQSPTDYWFVYNVINETWPYYCYDSLGEHDDWLTRKLGLLYFRLVNWRQPRVVCTVGYYDYIRSACQRVIFGNSNELVILSSDQTISNLECFYSGLDDQSVLVIDRIDKNPLLWQNVVNDSRSRVTFDLYYCGIVFFDKKRFKHNYIINF